MGTAGQGCWPNLCHSHDYGVNFPSAFQHNPTVSVSISGLDVDSNKNLRITVSAKHVSTTGFKASMSTWADTRLYAVYFAWVACGV